MNRAFAKLANSVARFTGRPWAFALCCLLVAVWAMTGPLFHYSDTWQPIGCKDAAEAAHKDERLASAREGVIAYSVSADTEMGDYDENPAVLFKAGRLPPPWDEV